MYEKLLWKEKLQIKKRRVILENVGKIFSIFFFQYSILYWILEVCFLFNNLRIIKSSVVMLRASTPLNPKYGWFLYMQNVPLL